MDVKSKKEELIKKIGELQARLRDEVETRDSRDETQRRELCIALGLYKKREVYSTSPEVDVQSWFQIFAAIGKMKAELIDRSGCHESIETSMRAYRIANEASEALQNHLKENGND